MNAHKFGYEYKEDEKINIVNDLTGREIIRMIEISHDFEKEIIEKLEANNKEIKQRLNDRINQLERLFEKESYTITLDKQETTFKKPLKCENCEIALVKFKSPALYNINEGDNIIEYYTKNDSDWKKFIIPKGCYTNERFKKYMLNNLKHIFSSINYGGRNSRIFLTKGKGTKLKVSSQYLADILKMERNKIYSEEMDFMIRLSSGKKLKTNLLINIHINCIKNNYFNEEESPIIYSFAQDHCEINEKPNPLIYYPIKENITDLKVEIKDKDGNKVNVEKCYLQFHIKN